MRCPRCDARDAFGPLSVPKRDPNPQPLTPEQQAILDAVPLRQPGPFDLFSRATTSTAAATPPTALDLAAVEKLLAEIPPEPIGEWMREQGCPPETHVLILPVAMRATVGPFPPRYVRFSLNARDPMLVRDLTSFAPWPAGVPEGSGR